MLFTLRWQKIMTLCDREKKPVLWMTNSDILSFLIIAVLWRETIWKILANCSSGTRRMVAVLSENLLVFESSTGDCMSVTYTIFYYYKRFSCFSIQKSKKAARSVSTTHNMQLTTTTQLWMDCVLLTELTASQMSFLLMISMLFPQINIIR